MNKDNFLSPAPPDYRWPQCPEADQWLRAKVDSFLERHSFAKRLSERMMDETSTEFLMWIDHLILPKNAADEAALAKIGFVKDDRAVAPTKTVCLWHPFADLPRILISETATGPVCAIRADSIRDFLLAHGLSTSIEGAPLSRYRETRIPVEKAELRVIERRGAWLFVPDKEDAASRYLDAVESWANRRRHFPSREEGLAHAQKLADKIAKSLGEGMAACAVMEAERLYWQQRNRAGQVQKARQDRLGLGWANHDHHTFRSSRPGFPPLIKILATLGFKKRERYYAGGEARWGAQIMEQPDARLIIFADVDLTEDDLSVDFSEVAMPELDKPGTIGLWCALHGESILESGMHHLEAQFDFDHMKASLKNEGVDFMKPFSDFPYLRQAFSQGETWKVPEKRLEDLRASKKLSEEAYQKIKQDGAVGSHLENLQRRNGFKGFNEKSVSKIIKEVNPERQAMK